MNDCQSSRRKGLSARSRLNRCTHNPVGGGVQERLHELVRVQADQALRPVWQQDRDAHSRPICSIGEFTLWPLAMHLLLDVYKRQVCTALGTAPFYGAI